MCCLISISLEKNGEYLNLPTGKAAVRLDLNSEKVKGDYEKFGDCGIAI